MEFYNPVRQRQLEVMTRFAKRMLEQRRGLDDIRDRTARLLQHYQEATARNAITYREDGKVFCEPIFQQPILISGKEPQDVEKVPTKSERLSHPLVSRLKDYSHSAICWYNRLHSFERLRIALFTGASIDLSQVFLNKIIRNPDPVTGLVELISDGAMVTAASGLRNSPIKVFPAMAGIGGAVATTLIKTGNSELFIPSLIIGLVGCMMGSIDVITTAELSKKTA